MAASAEPQQDRDPIADAARAAFSQAGGDVGKAAQIMEKSVRANRRLRDELTEPLISGACYEAVRVQCRVARGRVWRTSQRDLSKRHSDGVTRLTRHAQTLLAFPLLGGRHLGDAKRTEVLAAAEFFTRQAGDMATKGRWLRLVAEKLPAARKVSDVLNEAQLRALQTEARRDA